MNQANKVDFLLSSSKKIAKVKKDFDVSSVAKIVKIFYPEITPPSMKKHYKLIINYIDTNGKKRERTILFGEKSRAGCEYIHHKNKEVRDIFLKNLKDCSKFFDKNFLVKELLNGDGDNLTNNWELLKEKYL